MYIYSLVPQTWICHNSYCRKNKLHLSISSVLVASAVVIKFAVQAQAGDEIHIKLVQALPLLVETWSLIIIHISSERCDYVLSQVLSQVCWNMIQEIVLSQKPQVLSQVCWSSCTKNLLLKSTAVPRSTRVSVTWLLHDLWLSGNWENSQMWICPIGYPKVATATFQRGKLWFTRLISGSALFRQAHVRICVKNLAGYVNVSGQLTYIKTSRRHHSNELYIY